MKALFVIDVQQEYMARYDNDLLSRINNRISKAAACGELIVYVKNIRRLKSGDMTYEFADGLKLCSENIIYKGKASVFSNAELPELLAANHISEIETIGVDGCCCVAASSLEARKLGYDVTMPLEYIGTLNPQRFSHKKEVLKKNGIKLIDYIPSDFLAR